MTKWHASDRLVSGGARALPAFTSVCVSVCASAFGWAALGWAVAGCLAVQAASASEPGSAGVPDGVDFGAGLTLERALDLEEVARDPSQYTAAPILLHGRISDVCQRKGCWTVLSQGDANVRVRFKDYGFFLPKDSSGKQAYVEGVLKVETLSEKRARHYAEESKTGDVETIEGPQRELGFTASGVRLIE
jgi:hypothetical protein